MKRLSEVFGISPVSAAQLEQHGWRTVQDLAETPNLKEVSLKTDIPTELLEKWRALSVEELKAWRHNRKIFFRLSAVLLLALAAMGLWVGKSFHAKHTTSYDEALGLYETNHKDQAMAVLREAVATGHGTADIHNLLGHIYAVSEPQAAIKEYEKALEKDKNHRYASNNLGNVYYRLQRYDEAIENYQRAVAIYPKSADAYYNWGNALLALKQPNEAIKKFEKVLELKANADDAYVRWGVSLVNLKKYEEAIAKFQRALEINPKSADAYDNWGNALALLKKPEEAITKFQKALELQPDDDYAYTRWGAALVDLKKYDEAILKFEKALKINPKSADAYDNWGNAFVWLKKPEEAIKKFQKALELQADDDYACQRWGISLVNLQRYDEAIAKFEKAIEINPGDAANYVGSSWANVLGGHPKAAIVAAEKGLKVDPDQLSIKINLVHGYLSDKQYKKAEEIYLQNKGRVTDDPKTFGQVLLDDFKEFKRLGISIPDVDKMRRLIEKSRK